MYINTKFTLNQIIVSDLDGTFIESTTANNMSYHHAVEKVLGMRLPLYRERITRRTIRNLLPHIKEGSFQDIVEEKERIFPNYLYLTYINKELKHLYTTISRHHPIILLTHARYDRVAMMLAYHHIYNLFSKIYTYESYNKRNKYAFFADQYEVAHNCPFLFEDDPKDIESAINHGFPEENITKISHILLT